MIFNTLGLSVGGAGRHIIEMINHWDRCCKIDIIIPKLGYDSVKKFTPDISYNKMIVYQTPLERVRIASNWLLHYFMQLSRVIKTILLVLRLEDNYDIVDLNKLISVAYYEWKWRTKELVKIR